MIELDVIIPSRDIVIFRTLRFDKRGSGQSTGDLSSARGAERGLIPFYSTVTDFARLRGWSTSVPLVIAT